MGEIRQFVKVCGVNREKQRGECRRVLALFDTGAATTVINSRVAKELGVAMYDVPITVTGATGRTVQGETALAILSIDGCGERLIPMAVLPDADMDASGEEMILGHDYMQKVRMRLDMATNLAKCPRPKVRR